MDLDQIAQRLEELSLELENEELAALAEAVIRNETSTCGDECARNKRQRQDFQHTLEQVGSLLARSGVGWDRTMSNMNMGDWRVQAYYGVPSPHFAIQPGGTP